MEKIVGMTGLTSAHADPKLRRGSVSDGFLGTNLFTYPRFTTTHADVIDLPGHCHRRAIALELADQARRFRVISTHLSLSQLSLSQPLRIIQMRIVRQYLRRQYCWGT
ncbi:hypothetical protein [Yoonia sediminilitoris]|uniref:Uncharacterized protein n=1 Tax=Yoonia sediminilitoris TaxID=1286148 RepID=A0A2T6KRQ9_9RHOB|nr:hypothetical protein [Yoonia sediminilitoris]PUB19242.1 hypothetical protein C8N45_101837 [Yoonia sediminilitoris]RCW99410.1 hypothetical protein DFP92_101837 [Yoonia sediminilitoris]